MKPSFEKQRSVLRRPEVLECTGLSRSTIYRLMETGLFPRPIPLGLRSVGWLTQDIESWIDARVASRDSEEM